MSGFWSQEWRLIFQPTRCENACNEGKIPGMIFPGGGDTIVALATPPGRGAIAVVRMSGERAFELAAAHISPWSIKPRMARLCRFHDGNKREVLDQALVTVFLNPDSFTGEDMVEISSHGGLYTPGRLIAALVSSGARPAVAGEFTRRAVLNGKMDITQAEAIGDLIDARSKAMHRVAIDQLDGGLSRRVASLRHGAIGLESLIAYDIDFPEEDDGPISGEMINNSAVQLLSSLDALLGTIPAGELVQSGAIVVIAGEPNTGKSSLFNALLGQSRAIVTDVPGTTRDAIEGFVETLRWPIRLVDTAGLRDTDDAIEKLGIEVSRRYLAEAHVILACGETEESVRKALSVVRSRSPAVAIGVRTKSDLLAADTAQTQALENRTDEIRVFVSAETGNGLDRVLQSIDDVLTATVGTPVVGYPMLMRTRHVNGIRKARDEIWQFLDVWSNGSLPASVAAVHLRAAVLALEDLIGAVSTEDVLDRVFSSFCVGK